MDPETERQLASLIMEEASRLRREAERDGVSAYLGKPKIRARANPQFLQATVRSIQQSLDILNCSVVGFVRSETPTYFARSPNYSASRSVSQFASHLLPRVWNANRIEEVNEMWRRRNVELESEGRRNGHWRRNNSPGEASDAREDGALDRRHRYESDDEESADGALKDEELEQFLHSRLKRGRGAVGSRMDETGPYLPSQAGKQLRSALLPDERVKDDWEERIIGPQARPPVNGKQTGGWDAERWKRKERDSSVEEATNEEGGAKRRKDRKEKRSKRERDSKRDSKKKKKKKLEKSSKKRR